MRFIISGLFQLIVIWFSNFMELDRLLFEPKKLFAGTTYVSPEQANNLSLSQLQLGSEQMNFKELGKKFQSVQNGELERAIEGIPIPIDDISMSSLHSYQSMTPQQKISYQRSQKKKQYLAPTPVDSVLTSLNQQQIVEWSKSNVKPAFNGNMFPQVLAPSIEVSNETTAALQKYTHHTFGSSITTDKVFQQTEVAKYNSQLRTQVKQQQTMINSLLQQIQDLQSTQEQMAIQQANLKQSAEKNQRLKTLVHEMKTDIEQHEQQAESQKMKIERFCQQLEENQRQNRVELQRKDDMLAEANMRIQQLETGRLAVQDEMAKQGPRVEKETLDRIQNIMRQLTSKHKIRWDTFEAAVDRLFQQHSTNTTSLNNEIVGLKQDIEEVTQRQHISKRDLEAANRQRVQHLEELLRAKDDQTERLSSQLQLYIQKSQEQQIQIATYQMSLQQKDKEQQLKKSRSDTKLNSTTIHALKEFGEQEQSKNFIEFIQQLMQRISGQETELQQYRAQVEEQRAFKSTFLSQQVCMKTEGDEELQAIDPLHFDPETLSEEDTVRLLLSLLSRVSKSKFILRQLRRNKDFHALMKCTRDKSNETLKPSSRGMVTSMASPQGGLMTARDSEVNRKLSFNLENHFGFHFNRKNKTMTNLIKHT